MSCLFNSLRKHDLALLISCPGAPGSRGGLSSFDGSAVHEIDTLSTTGLCFAEDMIFRVLWAEEENGAAGEILSYDARGVSSYFRIDDLVEPHDIAWNGNEFMVVSTSTNRILWISTAGKIITQWQAPGTGDAWHLNNLFLKDGEVYVSAFGRFQQHREWNQNKTNGTGMVFNLATGRDILSGLNCPHNPRLIDGVWMVCNSGTGELLQIDPVTGVVRRRLNLGGWTRGVAVTDDLIFVGISGRRHGTILKEQARVAVVCRHSLNVLDQFVIPCREVYDLTLVPCDLLSGLQQGFPCHHTAIERTPLSPEACRVRIAARLPELLSTGAETDIDCLMENLATDMLVSAPPYPVHLSYKWIDPVSGQWITGCESPRTRLPRGLRRGQKVHCKVRIAAPSRVGNYILRITPVQEGVAWFDDLDKSNGNSGEVRVVASAQVESENVAAVTFTPPQTCAA